MEFSSGLAAAASEFWFSQMHIINTSMNIELDLVTYVFFCFFSCQQEVVPSYLATSPIPSDGVVLKSSSLIGRRSSVGQTIQTLGSAGSTGEAGGAKKRRKRRRKARADSLWREENGEYSEDEDMFTIDISSDEGTEMESRWDM